MTAVHTQNQKISAGGVKKTRNEGHKAITANRLCDGVPVYMTTETTWTLKLAEAAVFQGDAALAALKHAHSQETAVIGPYLMDVIPGPPHQSKIWPGGRGRLREKIRLMGPTVISDYKLQ